MNLFFLSIFLHIDLVLSYQLNGDLCLIASGKSTDASTSLNTQPQTPIDKHDDTWCGGISHENKQCK
ncbi:unnamed protein product [Adineta steineri]|uniref:Secreted protein n=1 Tax=Adineta steineri TaxID=433720 RepID=A0A819N258_9BILA|nr:unnamed protein product [Adineta steineri]CAF0873366.1 unnamed protein product [Adineta steineri]CAF3684788.1 unnamed protein product [Adineta steineri]CAF3987308.1 unnamed protein product [Adineta steineri]